MQGEDHEQIQDDLPQGFDQFFILMEGIDQGRDQRASGKQGGGDEDQGGHGAVPDGPVLEDGKEGPVGPVK